MIARSLMLGFVGTVLTALCGQAAEAPQVQSNDQELKSAVDRARSCVVKVECLDRAGLATPTVLSAVAIDGDGHLLTVGLRVAGNRKLCVRDSEGNRHEAVWLGADEQSGLALLKLKSGAVPAPPMAETVPEVGSAVIVVGNPFGFSHSVALGNVSGLDRSVSVSAGLGRGLIQFTAPVHPGDSGGLLADRQGRLVGIVHTALVEPGRTESADRPVAGIGFAIPAAEARRVAQRLREGAKIERGYLGVTGESGDTAGVRVTSVADGSPAQAAGLRVDDVVVAVDDAPVKDFDDLVARIERSRPGTELKLRVTRDGQALAIPVTLGERSALSRPFAWPAVPGPWSGRGGTEQGWRTRKSIDPDEFSGNAQRYFRSAYGPDGVWLGVETQPVSEALAKNLNLPSTDGALISEVIPGSPADKAGVRASDLIVSLDDQPVRSPRELHERIQRAGPGAKVKLGIVRDGKSEQLEVTLAAAATGAFEPWSVPDGRWLFERNVPRIEALELRVKRLEQRVQELEKRLQERSKSTE